MEIIVNGSIRIRPNFLSNGEALPIHTHRHDHTFFVPRGAADVELLRDDGTVEAVHSITQESKQFQVPIDKNRRHRVIGRADGTITVCIFASRFPEALIDRKGLDPDYDRDLEALVARANTLFGDVAEFDTGWPGASAGGCCSGS